MTQQCVLETDGYRIAFTLQAGRTADAGADLRVAVILAPYLGQVSVTSIPTCIALRDLQRLAVYLEEHMAQLRWHPDHESQVFVPLELGFQLQALPGEVDQDGAGECSIRVLVNVGQSPIKGHRVYVGGESVVTFDQMRAFLAALRNAVSALAGVPA